MSCNKELCCKAYKSEDYLVCTCMGVMKSEIIAEIEKGATTFEALSESLGVGTGCSSCVAEVHQILEKILHKNL